MLAAALEGTVLLFTPEPAPQGQTPVASPSQEGWEPYSSRALADALASGRPVLVDATAAWCATCQVNEWAVLDRPDVLRLLDQAQVVRIRADYTNPDPEVARWLTSVGRAGLPVYALYRPGLPVYYFPELLTDENFTAQLPGLLGTARRP